MHDHDSHEGDGPCDDGGHHDDRRHQEPPRRSDGPDTRFLQLEMSQVLLGEAEGAAKKALRELMVEAARERLREQFGEEIGNLADLAVDQLLSDIRASLEIEGRILENGEERRQTRERLRDIFWAAGDDEEDRES